MIPFSELGAMEHSGRGTAGGGHAGLWVTVNGSLIPP